MQRRALATCLLLGLGMPVTGTAATFSVTTTADALDANVGDGLCATAAGGCSLRAALQEANATAEADTIELPAGTYNLTLLGISEDQGRSGDLDIRSEVVINGAGAAATILDGQKQDRVLQVHPQAFLTLNAVTVRNGSLGQDATGAGIDNQEGRLIVNDSHLTLNYVFGMGGAINNFRGDLEINRSVISDNVAVNTGGGINNQDGNLTINYTTIHNNDTSDTPNVMRSTFGGGIYNSAAFKVLEINNSVVSGHEVMLDGAGIYHLVGTLRMTNSTVSRNQAGRNGGGVFYSNGNSDVGIAEGGNSLINVTIANNRALGVDTSGGSAALGGGGIYLQGKVPLQWGNTIVANNAVGGDCQDNGMLVSLGHNLAGDDSCNLGGDATSIAAGVAGLGDLADNGGPTLSHTLLSESQALDAGDDGLCPAIDQRGVERPASGCDIGAVEVGGVSTTTLSALALSQDAGTMNTPPEASGDLLTVDAGAGITTTFQGSDVDADPLTFEIVDLPTQGSVGLSTLGSNVFNYSARADASGSDSFTFRACDPEACSAPAVINISITNAPVSSDIIIQVAPGSGTITQEKQITLPDVDYSQPLGVLRFDIEGIATDPDANLNGTVVTINLPVAAEISEDAVVRKLNIHQQWETLGTGPDPLVSTATIDRLTKTITLVLRDNDRFDLNREVGVIEDPVALAVPRAAGETVDSGAAEPVETSAGASSGGSQSSAVSSSPSIVGGGGAWHPLLLALLGLPLLLRRRR